MEQDKLPEARASISYTLIDPAGFPCILTFRATTPKALFKTMEDIKEDLIGYEADIKFKKPSYEAKATQVTGDLDGDGATPPQKNLLIRNGKWRDGMTKAEAHQIIDGLSKSWGKN